MLCHVQKSFMKILLIAAYLDLPRKLDQMWHIVKACLNTALHLQN